MQNWRNNHFLTSTEGCLAGDGVRRLGACLVLLQLKDDGAHARRVLARPGQLRVELAELGDAVPLLPGNDFGGYSLVFFFSSSANVENINYPNCDPRRNTNDISCVSIDLILWTPNYLKKTKMNIQHQASKLHMQGINETHSKNLDGTDEIEETPGYGNKGIS